ncbi:EthD family reductase [Bacillus sp. JJ1566]|uniref:EthD family reductase n=1 Tax=Bacillus sp. JJ1566 TaxID=3122961 RepID=UPI002FFF52D9
MAKMIIMYEEPKDKEAFDKHYFNLHVPLGRKIPNILKDSVHRVIDSQNTNLNLYLVTVLEFENMEKLTEAFASPEAREAEADGPNLFQFLEKPPIITIVD